METSAVRKTVISGIVGVTTLALIILMMKRTFPGIESDEFGGGMYILAGIIPMAVAGALSVYLTFGEVSYSGEAINISAYAGCITAIPLLLIYVYMGLSGNRAVPYCLTGVFFCTLLSVVSGSVAFEILSFVEKHRAKR